MEKATSHIRFKAQGFDPIKDQALIEGLKKETLARGAGPFKEKSKSSWEISAIKLSLEAAKEYLEELTSLKLPSFPLDNFHLLSPNAFKKRFSASGLCVINQVYLKHERFERWHFISCLTHELAHLFSAKEILIIKDGERYSIKEALSGLNKKIFGGGETFVVINEALTEMLAVKIRERLISSKPALLRPEEGARLLNYASYPLERQLLNRLICFSRKKEKEEIFKQLAKSYLLGDNNFVDWLFPERKFLKELMFLGLDPPAIKKLLQKI